MESSGIRIVLVAGGAAVIASWAFDAFGSGISNSSTAVAIGLLVALAVLLASPMSLIIGRLGVKTPRLTTAALAKDIRASATEPGNLQSGLDGVLAEGFEEERLPRP